jgi:hypothetical protein
MPSQLMVERFPPDSRGSGRVKGFFTQAGFKPMS